jgi:hypothetical protein
MPGICDSSGAGFNNIMLVIALTKDKSLALCCKLFTFRVQSTDLFLPQQHFSLH